MRRPGAALDNRLLGSVMTIASAAILRFENVTLGYNRHPAVHHLSGEIAAGSLLAVVGPNGAGKSTLLKGIIGELRPLQGCISLPGIRREQIAYLAQDAALDTSFPITIHDFVAMGLWSEFGAFRSFNRKAKQRIEDAIAAVGLSGLENRPIGQVSGGQFQRARFARVILQNSPLVLLDEPYGAIDATTVSDLSALVQNWSREGRTVISVLHDFEHVRKDYPETLLLAREVVARGSTVHVLSEDNLKRARLLAETQSEATVCKAGHHQEAEHQH